MNTTTKTDSLKRDDMNPAVAPPALKLRTMHRVSVNGKWSTKIYTAARAEKIVSRACRMGADAYRGIFGKVLA